MARGRKSASERRASVGGAPRESLRKPPDKPAGIRVDIAHGKIAVVDLGHGGRCASASEELIVALFRLRPPQFVENRGLGWIILSQPAQQSCLEPYVHFYTF
jgi:hypothetical protein